MKRRLVENVLISPQFYQKVSQTQGSLKESVLHEGKLYEALAVYRFKFTRPGRKNLNGRVYDYKLWDLVIERMRGKSTLALMNHPPEDDPGDPKNIWAVSRNVNYDESKEFVEADFYIIDNEWGRTALGVLKAGGEIGLSSSGFGEFLSDGFTVDPDSFELERVADWVMEPSYEVFGRLDDKVTEAVQHTEEQSGGKENKMMELSERKIKKIVETTLQQVCESISRIANPEERRGKAKELLEMYDESELGTLKPRLEEIVASCDTAIKEQMEKGTQYEALNEKINVTAATLTENQEEITRLTKENADLSAKLKEALDTLDSASEFSKNTEKILTEASSYRQNSVPYKDYVALQKYTKKVLAGYAEQKKLLAKAVGYNKKLAEKLQKILQENKNAETKANTARELSERRQRKLNEQKTLDEKRRAFEAEQEKIKNANPEVVKFFRDTVSSLHPEFMEYKDEFLKKRTLFEAQLLVLQKMQFHEEAKRLEETGAVSDLSTPISEKRQDNQIPEPDLRIPKGYL